MQYVELGKDIDYIEVEKDRIPYTFRIKLQDRTYVFTIRFNSEAGFFTVDLAASDCEILCYGDIVRYGRPLFESVSDERFPLPVIVPYCLTGDEIETVTYANFGKEVKLYLFERR